MIVEGSKAKPRAREAIVVVLAVMLAVIQLSAVPAIADGAKRRIIPLTLSKGQNYTISDVKKGTAPGIKVVKTPTRWWSRPHPAELSSSARIPAPGISRSRWRAVRK